MADTAEVPVSTQAPPRQQAGSSAVAQWYDNVRAAPEWPYILLDLIMKASGPLCYLVFASLISNFVVNFVMVTLAVVVEFWTTKNITGRRLTGMRWWQIPATEATASTWRFEHRSLEQPDYQPSKAAAAQLWGGLLGLVIFWLVMAVFALRQPGYMILCVMALFFASANLLGYYRCRSWSSSELKAMAGGMGGNFGSVVSGLTSGMANNFMSVLNRV